MGVTPYKHSLARRASALDHDSQAGFKAACAAELLHVRRCSVSQNPWEGLEALGEALGGPGRVGLKKKRKEWPMTSLRGGFGMNAREVSKPEALNPEA